MKVEYKCLTCGQPFMGHECYRRIGKEKYCSRACYQASHQPRPGKRTPDVIATCGKCGKTFPTKPSRIADGRGKFCSRSCANSYFFTGRPNPSAKENIKKAMAAITGKHAWNYAPTSVKCQICGHLFNVAKNRVATVKYCSRKCMNEAKRRVTGVNHPLFTRQIRSCEWCGSQVYVKPAKINALTRGFRFCSRQCVGSWVKSIGNRTTSIERMVQQAFDVLHLPYEKEYRIGRYRCDFVLLDHKIVIETDGTYWHSLPKRKKLDKKKDAILKEQGWTVIRLQESDINSDLTKCLTRLNRLIPLVHVGQPAASTLHMGGEHPRTVLKS